MEDCRNRTINCFVVAAAAAAMKEADFQNNNYKAPKQYPLLCWFQWVSKRERER